MRILFNHGLTAGELYTNTPEKIINKNWKWFIDHYGWNSSYEDALSNPFKYCLSLIFNRIIDDKVRFKVPVSTEAYIDFEIVTGNKFISQKQNGRFSEIDFIESDFTGYFINYYFKTKAYQKSMPIYLGGELKKKFLSGINSGIKYYTIKDITLDDFIDDVHQKFNDLTRVEVSKLLHHGFRRMHSAIKFGCAISLISRKHDLLAYIGSLSLVPEKQIKEYSVRRDRKLRKIEGWKKTPFDGYYYIGLSESLLKQWVEDNTKSRALTKFYNIIPRKIKEELYYKSNHVYIFRFKRKKFKGWAYWSDKETVRGLEYLGEAVNREFIPSDKTWKELIKEYEKRSN